MKPLYAGLIAQVLGGAAWAAPPTPTSTPLQRAPAVIQQPAPAIQPVAPAPSVAPAPATGQLLPLAPIVVQPTCAERPAVGQPPAAEMEPAYGRLKLIGKYYGTVVASRPTGAWLEWSAVPGAVAYVVERSVDGSNAWSLIADTCSKLSQFQSAAGSALPQIARPVVYTDNSDGVIPRTFYAYRVVAIGAPGTGGGFAGRVWWNQIKWVAPDPVAPQWISTSITNTGALRVQWRFDAPGNPFLPAQPDSYVLSTTTGWTQDSGTGLRAVGSCLGFNGCVVNFTGAPSGTHVFTLTAQWIAMTNGVKQVVATTQADQTVTIP